MEGLGGNLLEFFLLLEFGLDSAHVVSLKLVEVGLVQNNCILVFYFLVEFLIIFI